MIRRKIAEKKLAKEADKLEVTLVALSGPSSSGKSVSSRFDTPPKLRHPILTPRP